MPYCIAPCKPASNENARHILVRLLGERLARAAVAADGDVAGVVRLAVGAVVALATRARVRRAGRVLARAAVRARRRRARVELVAVVAPEAGLARAQVGVARRVATDAPVGARLHGARVEELAAVAVVAGRACALVARVDRKQRARAGETRVVGAGWRHKHDTSDTRGGIYGQVVALTERSWFNGSLDTCQCVVWKITLLAVKQLN